MTIQTDKDLVVHRAIHSGEVTQTDKGNTLAGHFSVFNEPYQINSWIEGEFVERVESGAFAETFRTKGDKIRVLFEHGYDPQIADRPLGVPRVLQEDARGAYIEADLFDAAYVNELLPAIRSGVYGMSFGFRVKRDEWIEEPERSASNPNGIPERIIKEVDVREVSVTIWPANDATDVGVRSITDRFNEERVNELRSAKQAEQPSEDVERKVEPPADAESSGEVGAPAKESEARNTDNSVTTKKVSTSMRIEERRARLEEIRAKQAELFSDEMTDEQDAEYDTLAEERKAHEAAVEKYEARKAEVAKVSKTTGGVERGSGTPAVHTKVAVHDVEELRKEAYSGEHYRNLVAQNAERVLETADFSASNDEARAKRDLIKHIRADESGEFGRRVAHTSSDLYRSAFSKWVGKRALNAEEQRAMALGVEAQGGYGVPFDLDPTIILTSDGAINPLRRIARVERITGRTLQLVTSAGVTVYRDTPFPGEAVPVQDGSPTLAREEFNAGRVSAFLPRSIEIDAAYTTLDSQLTRALMEAKDEEEAETFWSATGNGLTGVEGLSQLAAPSLIDAGDPLTWEDVLELDNQLAPRHRARAKFLADNTVYNEVRLLDANNGGDAWSQRVQGRPAQINGHDAEELSSMPASGNEDDEPFLLYGDFQKYVIVDRIGMILRRDAVTVSPEDGGVNVPNGQDALTAYWWNGGGYIDMNAFRALVPASS